MRIQGFQKTSLVDYPKNICSTIFLQGCNFRCSYCHNPELVIDEGLNEVMEGWLLNKLEERKGLIDHICITGGEPTLHKDLPKFIKKLKVKGLKVKIDTNGSNSEMLKQLIKDKLVDFIAMDVKNVLEKYEITTNSRINVEIIKDSVKTIIRSGLEHEFRTTVLPVLHKKEDIVKIAKSVSGANKYVLQQFVPTEKILDENFSKETPYSQKELEEMRKECEKYVKTEIRNI